MRGSAQRNFLKKTWVNAKKRVYDGMPRYRGMPSFFG